MFYRFALLLLAWTAPAIAHGGGLDASGCHNDRRNGGYHCHRGTTRPPPSTRAPVRRAPTPRPPQSRTSVDEDRSTPLGVYAPPAPVSLPSAALRAPITGRAVAIDGDTLDLGSRRMRLWGIDAFEAEQRCGAYACGAEATHELARLIDGQDIVCIHRDTDRYGRTVAQCRAGEVDLGAHMVRAGLAIAYRQYALDYVPDEEAARMAQLGAWQSAFTPPTEFRGGSSSSIAGAQRLSSPTAEGCSIKGNINRRGERIYHLPSDPYYSRTNPEAMFCTEAEARAAGFRHAGDPH